MISEYAKEMYEQEKHSVRAKWNQFKYTARRKNRLISLTFEEYGGLVCLPCHYCNEQFESTGSGLDRIDNDLPYITTNVVPCCKLCNTMKMNTSLKDFKRKIGQIYRRLHCL